MVMKEYGGDGGDQVKERASREVEVKENKKKKLQRRENIGRGGADGGCNVRSSVWGCMLCCRGATVAGVGFHVVLRRCDGGDVEGLVLG